MSHPISTLISSLAVLGILQSAPMMTHAEVYKWKDDKGEIHYSQFPPENQKASRINVNTGTPDDSGKKALDKALGKIEAENKSKSAAETKKNKEADQLALRKKQCEDMRKNLDMQVNKRRVAQMKDGKMVVMPYEEREKQMQLLRDKIREHCSDL